MKRVKIAIAFAFIAGFIAMLSDQSFACPPFLSKAKKFGAKDCTFCHVDPAGGPPWNERGKWLVDEKRRRNAEAVDPAWLADYKPGQAKDKKVTAPAQQNSVEQELLKVEREWLNAYINHDVAAMERIEADEFTITFPNGQVSNKAQQVASLKQPVPAGPRPTFLTEETKVRVYGDVAILTGIFVDKRTVDGKEIVDKSRYTDVYVKRDGRWQVVASQLTALRPPQPAPPSGDAAKKVDPKVFDAYLGQYDTPFGVLSIMKEGDRLFGQPDGDTKEELIPQSETEFNVTNVGAKLTFVKDEKGQVTHIVINMNGQEVKAKKIK